MRLAVLALAALALATGTAAAAPPSPTTIPGWPISAPAGSLLPGPGGGVVLVAPGGQNGFRVSAYARSARRIWSTFREAACGDCDGGPEPAQLQPNGTYGPIGFTGDDFWAVSGRGTIVAGCAGVVMRDGTCAVAISDGALPPRPPYPVVIARHGGAVLWSVTVSDWTWDAPFAVPAMIVADASGRLYAAFDGLATAVDPSSHAIAWERHGPSAVLASLGSGVLALQGDGLVALAADGAERWRRPIPPGEHVFPAGVAYDAARGRVYVERSSGAAPGVTALDAATGAQLWRTTTADRARLLSVGRGGRVYLAIDRPGHLAVRGVRLTGATAWQRNARRRISDALELRNGTIAVSVDKRFGGPEATSLTLLDPR